LSLHKDLDTTDFSEEDYLKSLKTIVDQNNSKLLKIQEKRKAVKLFLDNVVSEADQIHEQLNSINGPWKGLLRRILINPLISDASLLSNTTVRNKLIAKTSATVHEQSIDIVNIASEAQLTDLQLTLMLTLANKYQWTPWKALLLDDPTQHHDLVHASSVFDLLRDYIIDLDYQVMMSTHDSIQAKFFQRKLENEGVPSKIYRLVVRKDGVTAEPMM
jgi:exonuclease SbcC